MRNIKLLLSYDGSRYKGWQRLGSGENTIQGKLEEVLTKLLKEPVEVSGSGRTDAGVHAMGQVANFHTNSRMSCEELCSALRQYLPEDIGVLEVTEAGERFHSRLNATRKTYVYRIWNSPMPCVFERKYVWRMEEPLNLSAMEAAAAQLVGTHDFLAFCSNKHFKKSSVRTIYELRIEKIGPEVCFTVTGDGFLYNMVRILVGTLLAVGRGDMRPEDMSTILTSRTRAKAGETVPPKGLCLMEVQYQ